MKKEILELLEKENNLTKKEIVNHFQKKLKIKLDKDIKELIDEGIIYYDESNISYQLNKKNFFETEVKINKKNIPYIIHEDKIINLNFENMLGAIPGDIVKIFIKDNKYEIIEIINREKSIFMVEVCVSDGIKSYHLKNYDTPYTIIVSDKKTEHLVDGDRIILNVSKEIIDNCIIGTIKKYICNKKDLDADSISLCASVGFRHKFSSATKEEIKKIPEFVTKEDKLSRVDLTDDLVVTIDPKTAKDLDDAYSLEKTDYGYLLKTHTADVAHYVPYNSALYKDALENSFSIYLANFVLPMFPHQISSGICSLHQNVERLARTMEIKLNHNGEIIDCKKYKSVIKSKKQMNYGNVQKVFDGDIQEGYENYTELLKLTKELALKLNNIKFNRGYLQFESNEIEFDRDNANNIIDIKTEDQRLAHEFIENIMVMTNNLKVQSFGTLPIIYRNHPLPDAEKIEQALNKLKELDVVFLVNKEQNTKKFLQSILKDLSTTDAFLVLTKVILTSFEKAYYDTENEGHFGLSLEEYTHTTSPIRRIVDYMVQYAEDLYEKNDITTEKIEEIESMLYDVAQIASEKERLASKVEYKSTQLEMAKFMQKSIGEEFTMYIADITPSQIVLIAKNMTEGKILLDNHSTQNLYYNPTFKGITDQNKNRYKISHKLLVRLSYIDIFSGSMEYELIENLTIAEKKQNQQHKKILKNNKKNRY